MNKIYGKEVIALINPEVKYELQELHDVVEQLKIEKLKNDADGGDIIVFRGKERKVKRATYDVIRSVMNSSFTERFDTSIASSSDRSKWYMKIPFVYQIVESIKNSRLNSSWDELCKLTFEGDISDFKLGDLTQGEVQRIMRIFFRFQAELLQDVQGT